MVTISSNMMSSIVNGNWTIQVEAPTDANLSDINKAVLKRARWVVGNVNEAVDRMEHVLPREYVSGETYFYLGKRFVLKVSKEGATEVSVKLQRGEIIIEGANHEKHSAQKLLNIWYRDHANKYFSKRICELSEQVTWLKDIPVFGVYNMKKQWGSCSRSGKILLNPHLIKAPRECIDYVIFHEICHLLEQNHSPRFYRQLEKLMPNWKSVKARLDGMAEMLLVS